MKNEKLHWFEGKEKQRNFLRNTCFFFLFLAVKLTDTSGNKSKILQDFPNYWQQELNNYSINELALNNELQSMIINTE